jgi:hypothetical protein
VLEATLLLSASHALQPSWEVKPNAEKPMNRCVFSQRHLCRFFEIQASFDFWSADIYLSARRLHLFLNLVYFFVAVLVENMNMETFTVLPGALGNTQSLFDTTEIHSKGGAWCVLS